MRVDNIIYNYLESIGGTICRICYKEWHHKSNIVCLTCEEAAEECLRVESEEIDL
tara:strand:- start:2178 stop:2342 length:165 start_codon:yes stop_codon:yes gene_type:complete